MAIFTLLIAIVGLIVQILPLIVKRSRSFGPAAARYGNHAIAKMRQLENHLVARGCRPGGLLCAEFERQPPGAETLDDEAN